MSPSLEIHILTSNNFNDQGELNSSVYPDFYRPLESFLSLNIMKRSGRGLQIITRSNLMKYYNSNCFHADTFKKGFICNDSAQMIADMFCSVMLSC